MSEIDDKTITKYSIIEYIKSHEFIDTYELEKFLDLLDCETLNIILKKISPEPKIKSVSNEM